MFSCENLSVQRRLLLGFVVGFSFGVALSALLTKLEEYEENPRVEGVMTRSNNESFHRDEDTIAEHLSSKVRVLCLVLTHPRNHHCARAVKVTWGRRCNVLLLMSTEEDKTLPTIALPVREGWAFLWGKVKASFKYIYKYHWNDFDWVLKADDDTFVVMENLRYMLRGYDASEAIYFGRRFQKANTSQGWMSGGAGYVLSKESVRRLIEEGLEKHKCREDDRGSEDFETSRCLELVGGKPEDSRDSLDRGRFFPFTPNQQMFLAYQPRFWYTNYTLYHDRKGINCCSDLAISFHYLGEYAMFASHFKIYHLRPYGTTYNITTNLNRRPDQFTSVTSYIVK